MRRQSAFLMRIVGHAAFNQPASARAACAIPATIRQIDAGADGSGENGVAFITDELMTAGLNGNLKTHTILTMNNEVKQIGRRRLLLLGCGDIGMRLLPLVRVCFRVFAVTGNPTRCAALRAAGAVPLVADLDQPATLGRLARLAQVIVHLAPPQSGGDKDRRTRNLAAILPDRANLVYISTTGVYGDCDGARFDETRVVRPASPRAQRRLDAETVLRAWARRSGSRLAILRTPGIYARDRLPLERLQKRIPALRAEDDVHTNHIHADDLAMIIVRAIYRARPLRVYHAVDDSEVKMGDYFDAVARSFDLPSPPRLPRHELQRQVSPLTLSFMAESRRLRNDRLRCELGVRLRHPDVTAFLKTCS